MEKEHQQSFNVNHEQQIKKGDFTMKTELTTQKSLKEKGVSKMKKKHQQSFNVNHKSLSYHRRDTETDGPKESPADTFKTQAESTVDASPRREQRRNPKHRCRR